jgi:hypothetical protein
MQQEAGKVSAKGRPRTEAKAVEKNHRPRRSTGAPGPGAEVYVSSCGNGKSSWEPLLAGPATNQVRACHQSRPPSSCSGILLLGLFGFAIGGIEFRLVPIRFCNKR